MPIDKRILEQLIVDAGSAEAALQALQRAAMRKNTLMSERAMAGIFKVTVTDWEVLQAFLKQHATNDEAHSFHSICGSVREAVEAKDGEAMLRNLLLAFRCTSPC